MLEAQAWRGHGLDGQRRSEGTWCPSTQSRRGSWLVPEEPLDTQTLVSGGGWDQGQDLRPRPGAVITASSVFP